MTEIVDNVERLEPQGAIRMTRGTMAQEMLNSCPFLPTHTHIKSGVEYEVMGETIDATNSATADRRMILYRNEARQLFVREKAEFEDGRFVSVAERWAAWAAEMAKKTPEELTDELETTANALPESMSVFKRDMLKLVRYQRREQGR